MDSELQDALDWADDIIAVTAQDQYEPMVVYVEKIIEAARKYANPDLDLAHRFDTMRIGGPTADSRVHLNGSLSSDEWGRLQAALGLLTEDK